MKTQLSKGWLGCAALLTAAVHLAAQNATPVAVPPPTTSDPANPPVATPAPKEVQVPVRVLERYGLTQAQPGVEFATNANVVLTYPGGASNSPSPVLPVYGLSPDVARRYGLNPGAVGGGDGISPEISQQHGMDRVVPSRPLRAFNAGPGHGANDADAFLAQGILAEDSNQNLAQATASYERAVELFDQTRATAANAIFRLAEAFRKTGQIDEAKVNYARILREFPDFEQLTKLSHQALLDSRASKQSSESNRSTLTPGATPQAVVGSASAAAIDPGNFVNQLMADLLKIQQQLAAAKVDYADDHPEVKKLKAVEAKLTEQIQQFKGMPLALSNESREIIKSLEADLALQKQQLKTVENMILAGTAPADAVFPIKRDILKTERAIAQSKLPNVRKTVPQQMSSQSSALRSMQTSLARAEQELAESEAELSGSRSAFTKLRNSDPTALPKSLVDDNRYEMLKQKYITLLLTDGPDHPSGATTQVKEELDKYVRLVILKEKEEALKAATIEKDEKKQMVEKLREELNRLQVAEAEKRPSSRSIGRQSEVTTPTAKLDYQQTQARKNLVEKLEEKRRELQGIENGIKILATTDPRFLTSWNSSEQYKKLRQEYESAVVDQNGTSATKNALEFALERLKNYRDRVVLENQTHARDITAQQVKKLEEELAELNKKHEEENANPIPAIP